MPGVELQSYRWVIVSAAALILAIAMGAIVNGMSAFIVPMQEAHGWARGDISLINVAGIVGLGVGGLVMGSLADRLGTRPVVLFGAVVMGLCYLLVSFATELWQYYTLIFIAGFFGAGAIFPPLMAAVGTWFPVGAGLAIGIASAGQALGQGAVPFVSSFLIQGVGIDGAFAVSGIAMLVALVPLALLLRPAPAFDVQGGKAVRAAAPEYPPLGLVVSTLCVAVLLCCTCMSVPLMHLVPLVQDRGFALEEASGVIFLMLMVAIAGRVFFGKLADIIGPLPAYMSATAWMGLLVYGFTAVDSLSAFYLYAVMYGFGYGGVMTGILISVAMLTHPSRRAFAMGLVTAFGWLGHANGGYLGGLLFDFTGGHEPAYGIAAASALLNLLVVGSLYLNIRRPKLRAKYT